MTQKAVSYRRCVLSPKQNVTLQQLVAAALVDKAKASDRFQPMNAQSTQFRCIGAHDVVSGCLVGYLTVFERGAAQPVINDDADATTLKLGALAPPKAEDGGVQQQFVPGVVYFAIHQNHLAIVQSASIRANALESHLSWLLKERTSHLPATVGLVLSDEAQKATKEKIRQSHVKKIALGQPLMEQVQPEELPSEVEQPAPKGQKKGMKPAKFRPHGPAVEFLRSFFPDENQFEKLGFDEVFDGNLEVWIEVRYPKRKRSKPEDAVKFMDTLGIALRDVEGDQVALELADGKTVTGKELKIASTLEAPLLANGLPDHQKLWDAMVGWMLGQISNGVIDP
ncbi:MAG: hypothetical protein KBC94_07825 [Pseudacidovorax sp.]|nr:hypothetical protein [Pseudacidovorax sp.]